MARTGRQPRQQAGSSQPRPSKPKPSSKPKAKQSKRGQAGDSHAPPLDVYSYSTNMKRARGDVDPEARASFKGQQSGKGKARESDDEEFMSEDDLIVGADGFVEFTGVKPKGLKMGMSDDDEGGAFGSEDDEEIDSDEAFEDEEDLPAKAKKVSTFPQCRRA